MTHLSIASCLIVSLFVSGSFAGDCNDGWSSCDSSIWVSPKIAPENPLDTYTPGEIRGPLEYEIKFSCRGRRNGYFADLDHGCKVWHYCNTTREINPINGLSTWTYMHFSYACLEAGQRWDQVLKECVYESKALTRCVDSELYYPSGDNPNDIPTVVSSNNRLVPVRCPAPVRAPPKVTCSVQNDHIRFKGCPESPGTVVSFYTDAVSPVDVSTPVPGISYVNDLDSTTNAASDVETEAPKYAVFAAPHDENKFRFRETPEIAARKSVARAQAPAGQKALPSPVYSARKRVQAPKPSYRRQTPPRRQQIIVVHDQFAQQEQDQQQREQQPIKAPPAQRKNANHPRKQWRPAVQQKQEQEQEGQGPRTVFYPNIEEIRVPVVGAGGGRVPQHPAYSSFVPNAHSSASQVIFPRRLSQPLQVHVRSPQVAPVVVPSSSSSESPEADFLGLPIGSTKILGDKIDTSFDCTGKTYGYYADVKNQCKVYHVCSPKTDEFGVRFYEHYSFVCAEGLQFDQQKLTCVPSRESSISCLDSEKFFVRTAAKFHEENENWNSRNREAASATPAPVPSVFVGRSLSQPVTVVRVSSIQPDDSIVPEVDEVPEVVPSLYAPGNYASKKSVAAPVEPGIASPARRIKSGKTNGKTHDQAKPIQQEHSQQQEEQFHDQQQAVQQEPQKIQAPVKRPQSPPIPPLPPVAPVPAAPSKVHRDNGKVNVQQKFEEQEPAAPVASPPPPSSARKGYREPPSRKGYEEQRPAAPSKVHRDNGKVNVQQKFDEQEPAAPVASPPPPSSARKGYREPPPRKGYEEQRPSGKGYHDRPLSSPRRRVSAPRQKISHNPSISQYAEQPEVVPVSHDIEHNPSINQYVPQPGVGPNNAVISHNPSIRMYVGEPGQIPPGSQSISHSPSITQYIPGPGAVPSRDQSISHNPSISMYVGEPGQPAPGSQSISHNPSISMYVGEPGQPAPGSQSISHNPSITQYIPGPGVVSNDESISHSPSISHYVSGAEPVAPGSQTISHNPSIHQVIVRKMYDRPSGRSNSWA